MFTSILTSNLYQTLSKWAVSSKEKNIIIDPLSCFIKLGLLNFYPIGTKISITNNQITFNEPGYMQGVVRTFKGDGRDDLHNVFNPIQKCIKWYWRDLGYEVDNNNLEVVDNKNDKGTKKRWRKTSENTKQKLALLFQMAIAGLYKLKRAYSPSCTIQHALDRYIDVIENKRIIKSDESENLSVSEDENSKIHQFLKDLWNDREIEIIANMMEEFNAKKEGDDSEKDVENIIVSITTYTENKERKLHEFLERHTKVLL